MIQNQKIANWVLKKNPIPGFIVFIFVTSGCFRHFRIDNNHNESDSVNVKSESISQSGVKNKSSLILPELQNYVFIHSSPTAIFAGPAGVGNGSSVESPVMLEYALTSSNIIPGDTLFLINGIYKGTFQVNLKGANGYPVTIRPVNDYLAVIDGGLTIGDLKGDNGSHIVIRDLIITNSDPWRGTWETPQGTISRGPGINVQAHSVSLINNLIHDGGIGVCGYNAATDCLVYGNVIWNSGWADDVLGGAQNIYMHGNKKVIRHNVFAGAFKRTVQFHGNQGALTESSVSENVAICRESFLAGSYNVPNRDLKIEGNHILGWAEIGYVYDPNENVTVNNNIIYSRSYSGIRFQHWENINFYGNKIIKPSHLSVDIFLPSDDPKEIMKYNIDSNQYYQSSEGYREPFEIRKHKAVSFSEWQKEGFDVNGSFAYHLPDNNETYVYPDEFPGDSRQGIVVIWNWEGLDQVSVNLEKLELMEGKTYLWRNAQDPLGDTSTWTFSGEPFSFPMTGRTVAYPVGFDELLVPNQFPAFGCFIIEGL